MMLQFQPKSELCFAKIKLLTQLSPLIILHQKFTHNSISVQSSLHKLKTSTRAKIIPQYYTIYWFQIKQTNLNTIFHIPIIKSIDSTPKNGKLGLPTNHSGNHYELPALLLYSYELRSYCC